MAEGVEWTRAQVVEALQERIALQPKAQAADAYQAIFRMDPEKAQEVWAPIISRLSNEAETRAFVAQYFDDPDKAAYLNACLVHYNTEVGEVPAPTAAAPAPAPNLAADPNFVELKKQNDELAAWRNQKLQQEAVDRGNRELAQITGKYPFIASDETAKRALFALAKSLYDMDRAAGKSDSECRGLIEAMQMNAPLYDARLIVAQQQQAEAEVPPVPATLGSPGASPTGSRQPRQKPPKFSDPDEATDAWYREHP